MSRREHRRRPALKIEALEDRELMSGFAASHPHATPSAMIGHLRAPTAFSTAGERAILAAYFGGAGHEWVTLAQRDMRGLRTQRFGPTLEYRAAGLVAEEPPYLLGSYKGDVHDRVAPSVAGMALLAKKQIELGVIMRGPFTNYDGTDYVTFAIDRGTGGSLPPVLASEPGIAADALVTIAVGPNGSTYSGTITDRVTGATQTLSPGQIRVQGSTLRVLLDAGQLPSEGLRVTKYRFAVFTSTTPDPALPELASVVPQDGVMIPIGVETDVRPTF